MRLGRMERAVRRARTTRQANLPSRSDVKSQLGSFAPNNNTHASRPWGWDSNAKARIQPRRLKRG